MLIALFGKLTNNVIAVSSERIALGALTAGATGYAQYSITIPEGYKTTGIVSIARIHPANGSGFYAEASIPIGSTGVVTSYYVYGAITSVSADRSDFSVLALCVKS